MNKDKVITHYFNKIDHLTITNRKYQSLVDTLIMWLLKTDEIMKDITTKVLHIEKNQKSKATIISKQEITLAGVEEVVYLLKKHTTLQYKVFHKDGDYLNVGDAIIELYGVINEILAYERVILNILQRFSGIATATYVFIAKLESLQEPPFIAATRKTNWGLLDKKAVALGGGLTHRLSLSDGILVKDNHLFFLQRLFHLQKEEAIVTKALELSLKGVKNMLIEIEVEKKESVISLIETFLKYKTNNVLGVLLDNFSPSEAKKVLKEVKKQYDISSIVFEASGGITGDNIVEWAQTGVDIISLGALTHSSKAADISLDLL
ncbi:MAG TPA: carboxylating nicotinate-nucleotide diphosphorylase [Candidatus Sulfotelmatobacter sp.]|jgi:nicotinate-nucleotide pyrophosphorylase (carboxylating)|nr:carboxylating nicotinate-nucleotide diphosphorylase [Candidatus Sulfotelmatobacter sp.]